MINRFILVLSIVSTFVAVQAFAGDEESAYEKSLKALPKSGVLSSSVGSGLGKSKIPTWTDTDVKGDELPPIAAGVSRSGPDSWTLRVSNNTEDTFSFSVSVDQLNDRNTKVRSDSFTFSLKGGQSDQRKVTSAPSSVGAQAVLQSWKRTFIAHPPKKAEGGQAEGTTKPQEAPIS